MSNNPLENRIFAAQHFSDYKHQYKKVKISIQHLPFNKTLEGCYAPVYSCILKIPQVGGSDHKQLHHKCTSHYSPYVISLFFLFLKAVVVQSPNRSWISLSFQLTEPKVLVYLCVKMNVIPSVHSWYLGWSLRMSRLHL